MKLSFLLIIIFASSFITAETFFVRPDNINKLKLATQDCAFSVAEKVPRTSFWMIKSADRSKSLKCLNVLSKIVIEDKPLNISYKSEIDPLLKFQWHLENTGQAGTAGEDASAVKAWQKIKDLGLEPGKGVKIGVIDDAFDLHHPDMEGKFLYGMDLADDDDYPYADENEPHGTCVTGVIAAVKDNGIGVSGACPQCVIVPVRASDKLGTLENMLKAFNYLLDRGVHVISNSWGPSDGGGAVELPEPLAELFEYAKTEARGGLGVTILFAAGNGNEDISDPDSFDGFAANEFVIAVGAVNADGVRSAYSDFGKDLDIVSPSSDIDTGYVWDPYATDNSRHGIWTIDARSWYGYSQMDYTGSFGGTSSATPLVSGIVGMLISLYPDATTEEIREILISSTDKVSPADAQYDDNGFSNLYGYGRINAAKAVEMLCEMKECSGGLDSVDEDTYPSRVLDEDFINDNDIETGDDVLIPDSRTVSGCSLTTIF